MKTSSATVPMTLIWSTVDVVAPAGAQEATPSSRKSCPDTARLATPSAVTVSVAVPESQAQPDAACAVPTMNGAVASAKATVTVSFLIGTPDVGRRMLPHACAVNLILVCLSFVAICLLVPSQGALAWSNGENGPNSFGTHDWILREAIEAAGPAAAWVCRREALRATDDRHGRRHRPCERHGGGTSTTSGARPGAERPEAVEVRFNRARTRLENGHPCSASRAGDHGALRRRRRPAYAYGRLARS